MILEAAGTRRRHEDRFAAGFHRVRIGARVEERVDERHVLVLASQRERGFAVVVGRIHVSAGRDQQPSGLGVVVVGRPKQRRRSIRMPGVDVQPLLQQGTDDELIVLLCRINQSNVVRRGGHARDGSSEHGSEHGEQDRSDGQLIVCHTLSPIMTLSFPTYHLILACHPRGAPAGRRRRSSRSVGG